MLAMSKDNLKDVRAATGEIEIGQVVDFVDPHPVDPRLAEIPAAFTRGCWHVIETMPNQEGIAASHLVGRRFGIYVPETEHTIIRRGRKVDVRRPMFPGYVFVFVWDIAQHWRRLRSIPGVARIVTMTAEDGTIEPAVVPDAKIDLIRLVENSERPLWHDAVVSVAEPAKKKRSKRRKGRKHKEETADVIVGDKLVWRTWDAFRDGIADVDSDKRNQTLIAALSLPSQQPLVGSVVSGVVD
ncbi:transcription termination/antitermination NusG family protein [Bradyrhizobium sp. HKCCYLR1051]|uniref:transcription termination/antitermination NusG family protein n=1 Tax=Bradyrhizobium sp. HKCCYLR1051 TaxID=3420738 RepID=UPI003EB75D66